MTQVYLKYRRIDGDSLDGSLVTSGAVTITPLARRDTTSGQMTTAELTVSLGLAAPSVVLAAGTYQFRVRAPGLDNTEIRLVPGSGGPFDVDDLDEVAPTGEAALDPEWKAYIDAAIAGVSVGSTTPAGITGSTAIGQALIVAASQSSARSTIAAAASTHTHVATTDLTATGTKSSATFLRGDDTWATPAGLASAWADVTGKPSTFTPSAHTHTVSDITGESTAVGNLLTAASGSAACDAIDAIYSTAVTEVQYSATAPTGAATNGVLVLTPVT